MSGAVVNACAMSEDDRIELMGRMAMREGRVEFVVDGDAIEKGKADRYVRKLRERFPRLHEVSRKEDEPVKNTVTIRMAILNA